MTNHTLSKTIAFLAGVITLSVGGISTYAQEAILETQMVNAPAGLHLRDQNCNIIDTMQFGSIVIKNGSSKINCAINGQNVNLSAISYEIYDGYAATSFLKNLEQNNPKFANDTAIVTAKIGLNIRDESCHKIGVLPLNAKVTIQPTEITNTPVCEVKGIYYLMTPISSNGKTVYMANKYLK